ncbi:MAG: PAS domain S-box protein [Holophaga sp.]|nr:PAS domain S-box protein [Holophaga sp.]
MSSAALRTSVRPVLATLLPVLACVLQWLCWPLITPYVWFLFYPVVFLSAWLGGFLPGLGAACLSTALVWWFFIPPVHALVKPLPATYLNAGMFLVMGGLFSYFHQRLRQAELRATEARLREQGLVLDRLSRLAKIGNWSFDVATLKGTWSEEVARIHDLDPSIPPNVQMGLGYYHEEDRPAMAEAVRRCVEEGQAYDLELRLVSARGVLKWVRAMGSPVFQDGRVVQVRGALEDITERKVTALALQKSEERYRSLFEQAGVGVVVIDSPAGRLCEVNDKFCDILGYTKQELLGKSFLELTHPEERDRDRIQVGRLVRGELAEYRVEKRYLHKDGSTVWAALAVRPLYRSDHMPLHNVSIVADITARKQAEAEILRLNATLEGRVAERTMELQAVNQELETFAYAVSHDLRAPLRAMTGFSQALQEDCGAALPPVGKGHLERIIQASQRMAGLIEGLLQMSRTTRLDLERVPVDLSAQAGTLLADLARNDPERRVRIRVEPGILVKGDPRMLESALTNLLGNAWKYTSKTADASITVDTVQEDGQRWIRIADNGSGFDMAYAGKLFQPFQRLHRQDEFPGLGIGLATVQRVVQRHGGRLKADSAPGRGATFSLVLPGPDGGGP